MFYGVILGLFGAFIIGLIVLFIGCALIISGFNDLEDEYRPLKKKHNKSKKSRKSYTKIGDKLCL